MAFLSSLPIDRSKPVAAWRRSRGMGEARAQKLCNQTTHVKGFGYLDYTSL
jgi:hypothetical protein